MTRIYTRAFREMLKESGVKVVRLPARSPNLNSYAERWIRSVRGKCLSRVIPLGERHLRQLFSEYWVHFHQERNHQGLDNRIIESTVANTNSGEGMVQRRERIGGLLNYYLESIEVMGFLFPLGRKCVPWIVMNNRYVVNWTPEERQALTLMATRERVSGLKRQRAKILLLADEGMTDEEIADDVDVGVATVERVRTRCVERGLEASLDRKPQDNPPRQPKLDGATEAQLVQIACSAPPLGRTRWTVTLLADRLVELKVFESISTSTVQRALRRTNSSNGASSSSLFRR